MAKIVLMSGSLRKDSLNTQFLKVHEAFLKSKGVEVFTATANDLNIPLFNEDDESTKFPASVKALGEIIAAAQGVIIATPEYNGSISPVLKNFIDWTSRLSPHPWKKKAVLLTGTSPGAFGAYTGLVHTRAPLDRLGAFVAPQPLALPHGDQELGGTTLKDEKKQKNLEAVLTEFLANLVR